VWSPHRNVDECGQSWWCLLRQHADEGIALALRPAEEALDVLKWLALSGLQLELLAVRVDRGIRGRHLFAAQDAVSPHSQRQCQTVFTAPSIQRAVPAARQQQRV
jgi:hypothetical protein